MGNNTSNGPVHNSADETRKTNLAIYNEFRSVPDEAKKAISEGRLKGKTDINPMWRIKRLTELFGPCGIGWKVEITRMWTEQGDDDTVAAFVNINLYVRSGSQWSEAIPGTGGNVFRRKELSGKNYIDDDCYKKALTDAMSIACKWLGMGADVYYEKDPTSKYASGDGSTSGRPTVKERPQTGTAPQRQGTKPALTPQSPFWLQSVTIAMQAAEDFPGIRRRIENKFSITDADFLALMKQAGRISQDATSI